MTSKIRKLFVYGTLLRGERRSHFLNDCILLDALDIPGELFYTDKGYPTASFSSNSNYSVLGELYEIPRGMIEHKLAEIDNIEGTDTGLFLRKIISHNRHRFYAYEADKSLRNSLRSRFRIKSGNWRSFGSIAKLDSVKYAIGFEHSLDKHNREFPSKNSRCYIHLRGEIPILVCAPHSSVHIRMDKLKKEERYTAPLSAIMHSITGTHALFTHRASRVDPNFYDNSPFKMGVENIVNKFGVKFVIDIHGTETRKGDEVYFGVGTENEFLLGKKCYLEKLLKSAQKNRIRLGDPDVFPASRQMTVTKFISRKLGIPAIQIEINKRLRNPEDAPRSFLRLVSFLSDFISSITRFET